MQHYCIYFVHLMMKEYLGNMDFWGSTASIACAIHCAMLPVLFSFGVMGSHHWFANPWVEIIMLAITSWFIYQSLIKGYLSGSSSKTVFSLAIVGLVLLVMHYFLGDYGTLVVVFGGIMVASAHLINLKSHKHSKA